MGFLNFFSKPEQIITTKQKPIDETPIEEHSRIIESEEEKIQQLLDEVKKKIDENSITQEELMATKNKVLKENTVPISEKHNETLIELLDLLD